ncbi:hypothetical protein SAMN06265173_11242 [Thalassovita litoralis]|uniref:Uncharacterized protein n=1 Tax=Thalassovita litoralis TaxID=1010611 RepID=A0A521DSV6_9RHOB|nr:hypothetical protein [Thalassovita litoralis]SMO73940.1 hypothetical protein SAMN06265173_11242 [Thalassovita litoralis]
MSLMPITPPSLAAGLLTMTAGYYDYGGGNYSEGWWSALLESELGAPTALGSVTGPQAANGGTIEGAYWDSGLGYNSFTVRGGSAGLSIISVSGTPYALTFGGTYEGYDLYSFSSGVNIFTDGVDYTIEVS